MKRRNFLRAIAALPFVPAALKGDWAYAEDEETPRCGEATEPAKGAHTHSLPQREILAYAEGHPTEITAVIPPGRKVRVHASALMVGINGNPVELRIYQDRIMVAGHARPGDMEYAMDVETVLAPTPGTHTYSLGFAGAVSQYISHRPWILVELLPSHSHSAIPL